VMGLMWLVIVVLPLLLESAHNWYPQFASHFVFYSSYTPSSLSDQICLGPTKVEVIAKGN
jgi:hypothetical protein